MLYKGLFITLMCFMVTSFANILLVFDESEDGTRNPRRQQQKNAFDSFNYHMAAEAIGL